jgi:hypothetical protein
LVSEICKPICSYAAIKCACGVGVGGEVGFSNPHPHMDAVTLEYFGIRYLAHIDYIHGIGNTPTHSIENVLFQRGMF